MTVVLFDEAHSETWSTDRTKAASMQPENPANSSYAKAGDILSFFGFDVVRNIDEQLTHEMLRSADVLVVVHPCSPEWESTTGGRSPWFSEQEIADIQGWVHDGGSIFVLSEYENSKYGNNLNDLVSVFGAEFTNSTFSDKTNCHMSVPTWVLGNTTSKGATRNPLLAEVSSLCFYRAGGIRSTFERTDESVLVVEQPTARPIDEVLVHAGRYGKGRYCLCGDTDLFGDEYIGELDHLRFFGNIVQWLAVPSAQISRSGKGGRSEIVDLMLAVDRLRSLQSDDGSIDNQVDRSEAGGLLLTIKELLTVVIQGFPHQSEYLSAAIRDLDSWQAAGYQIPHFDASLAAFTPAAWRADGYEVVSIFPQTTPNGPDGARFEALHFSIIWPSWLADFNDSADGPQNGLFVSAVLHSHTAGYSSHCAVLFPSNVTCAMPPTPTFGVIFASREAERFAEVVHAGCLALNVVVSPDLELLLADPIICQETFALWDLVHDSAHHRGYLPLLKFLEGVPQPYWMGAIEELRVDLHALDSAALLLRDGIGQARFVAYAVVLDRIIRFPISGSRVRNFDGLAGQVLFSRLYESESLSWESGNLTIRWPEVTVSASILRREIDDVYRRGVVASRLAFWRDLHHLVEQYVPAADQSVWSSWDRGAAIPPMSEAEAIALQLPDEFPLGQFHGYLRTLLADELLGDG